MASHRACRIVLALMCMIVHRQTRAQVVVAPGDRVRVMDVSSHSSLAVGELVRLTGDSATISTSADRAPTAPTIWAVGGPHRLEVRSVRRHTMIGIQVGMLAGAAIGKAIHRGPGNCTSMTGTCVGMFAGMLLGGIVGHHSTSDVWRRVDYCLVCVAMAPGPRGALLSASIAF